MKKHPFTIFKTVPGKGHVFGSIFIVPIEILGIYRSPAAYETWRDHAGMINFPKCGQDSWKYR